MAADNAQLLLSIDASTQILREEIARGTAVVAKFAETTERDAGRAAEAFTKLGERAAETAKEFALLGAEILIGSSIKSAIESSIEYSESLVKTAQQLGTTTRFLQEFRYAAQQSAVSAEAADKSLGKFSVTLGKAAEGNKEAADSFSKIGVNIADASGNLRPSEAIFRDVADAIAKLPSPAQQAAAAVAIFGRGGQSLIPILKGGADGINAFAEEAEKAGLILKDGAIDKLEELSNSAKKVKQEFSTGLARVIADNAEALFALGRGAESAANYIGKLIDRSQGLRFLSGLGDEFHALSMSREDLARLATDQGRHDYNTARLDEARDGLNAAKKNPGFFGQGAIDDAQYTFDERQKNFNQSFAKVLTQPLAAPKEGDSGAAGGPVIKPEDKDAERAAREAARERAKAERERIEAINNARDFDKQIAAEGKSEAEARVALSGTAADRVELERQEIEDARKEYNKQIALEGPKDQGGNGKFTAAEIAQLQAANDATASLKQIKVVRDAQQATEARGLAVSEDALQAQITYLSDQAALATTADQRRLIELQILALQKEVERKTLQATIDNTKILPEDKAVARQQLAGLDAKYASKRATTLNATDNPLEAYLKSLPTDAAKAKEALESVEAEGLKSLTDGITDAITGAKSLGDAFSDVSKEIIADLVKIAVEKEIVGPLADLLGLGSGGGSGGGGGFLSSLFGGGFADGGVPPAGKISLVGERGPELLIGDGRALVSPPQILSGGQQAQRIDVHVHTTSDVAPSPLFVHTVSAAVQAGVVQSADDRRKAARPRLAGGRG